MRREVTVALGFKGAPVIRLLDTSQKPQAEAPTRGDYIFCLDDRITIIPSDILNCMGANKPSYYKLTTDYLTSVASEAACGSDALYQDYLQVIQESLQKFPDADKNTPQIHMEIRDTNNKKLFTFAGNYPTYPLEWCKPATQRMVCLEVKEGTSGSLPTHSSDSAQFESRKRALIDGPVTDLSPRKRANTGPSPISENRTGQPMEENTISQLNRLSFELSVTAPDSMDALAFFDNMNFSESRSIRSVFDNDRSPSNDQLQSPQYEKFKIDFQNAISNMDGEEYEYEDKDKEFWVRVKLKTTKNQDTGPSPAESPLEHNWTYKIFQLLENIAITGKLYNTNPKI